MARGGPLTMPWCGQAWAAPLVVGWHGGSPRGLPSASLPHFWYKNLKRFFQIFSRNFIFEDFLEIDKRLKTRENEDGMIASKSKPSIHQL
jgi:hypothetical protein